MLRRPVVPARLTMCLPGLLDETAGKVFHGARQRQSIRAHARSSYCRYCLPVIPKQRRYLAYPSDIQPISYTDASRFAAFRMRWDMGVI